MVLLAPTAAIIAGALAAAWMVAIHVLRLRRRSVRVSSILHWGASSRDVEVNVPLRWLRTSWLMVLQLAALACLAMALGRPALVTDGPGGGRLIVVLDRSASMNAVDQPGGPSRLELAKRRGAQWIRSAARAAHVRVTVVSLAHDARIEINQAAPRAAQSVLELIEPTDQLGNLSAAVGVLRAICAGPGSEEAESDLAEVLVLSDGDFDDSAVLSLPGARLAFERIGAMEPPANLGIVGISGVRDHADPGLVRVFLRVQSSRPRESAAAVALAVDGREVARRAVRLDPLAGAAQGAETFDVRLTGGAVISASVLPGGAGNFDALPADDQAWLVMPAPSPPRMVVVTPDLAGPPGSPGGVLRAVVEELRPASLRFMSPQEYADALDQGPAIEADVVILDRVPFNSARLATPAIAFAETSSRSSWRGFVTYWDRDHPVLRDVSMDTVYVANPAAVPASDPGWRAVMRSPAGVLASVRDTPPRSIWTALSLENSTWALDAGFPIFLANAIEYITFQGDVASGVAYTTGQPITIRAAGPEVVVVEALSAAPTRVRAIAGEASLGVAQRVGVKRVEGLVGGPRSIAVNLADPRESRVGSKDAIPVAASEAAAGDRRGRQEIWPWLVVAGGTLLMAEFVASAHRRRRP